MDSYNVDSIKTVPNKELHITPSEDGFTKHYGKVLTIGVLGYQDLPLEEPAYSQIEAIVEEYPTATHQSWVKFCYIESPTMSTKKVEELKIMYLPKPLYLRRTTLLR